MFTKKTIHDVDVHGKTVLLRADYNVPLDATGAITDDFRIKQSVPTLQMLLEQDVRLVICSHLGRPDGKPTPSLSLAPVAKRLSELLGKDVAFAKDCIGPDAEKALKALKPGAVLLLENLRFHAEEEKNDDNFAAELAKGKDIFVQDGFGVVHRAHASTEAITHHLPSVAGLLLEKEVDTITRVMATPDRPLMAIIGGAKISDKIDVLNKFIDIADFVAVGGAMANTFLVANGVKIAKSKVDQDDVPVARDILQKAREKAKKTRFIFYVPQDGVVATSLDKTATTRIVDWDTNVIADVESYPKQPPENSRVIADDEMILDIGPFSGAFIAGGIQLANTVVWNGTMGVTETPALTGPVGPFAHGTELIIDAMLGDYGHRPFSLVGGGDTVGYVEQRNLTGAFNHVSTGGGASLDLMAGRKLPGVEALQDK
ncbi:MAG TPA: phosphoglycerate kinase [Candidatus Saccharimonadales bacterium]|jgi:phosphoglycerate kinase|nr:phosphoglycerate kinase [Candidatus Saccharimonadales bacterium]